MRHHAQLLCRIMAEQVGYGADRQGEFARLAEQVVEEYFKSDDFRGMPTSIGTRDHLNILCTCLFRLSERIKDKTKLRKPTR